MNNPKFNARRWRIFDAQPLAIKRVGWETNLCFDRVVPHNEVEATLAKNDKAIQKALTKRARQDVGVVRVKRERVDPRKLFNEGLAAWFSRAMGEGGE